MVERVKSISQFLLALTSIAAFIASLAGLFGPSVSGSVRVAYYVHVVRSLAPEFLAAGLILGILWIGLRFRLGKRLVDACWPRMASRRDQFIYAAILLIAAIGVTGLAWTTLARPLRLLAEFRYDWYKDYIYGDFRKQRIAYVQDLISEGKYASALGQLNAVLSAFPDDRKNELYKDDIRRLEGYLAHSERQMASAISLRQQDPKTRDVFYLLLEALRTNPENEDVATATSQLAESVRAAAGNAELLQDACRDRDSAKIRTLVDQFGWYLFDPSVRNQAARRVDRGADVADAFCSAASASADSSATKRVEAAWELDLYDSLKQSLSGEARAARLARLKRMRAEQMASELCSIDELNVVKAILKPETLGQHYLTLSACE